MKKGIILYQSKYGATKKYAEWLTQSTGFDCIETKNADIKKVKEYDIVILGGGIYASGISGFSFLKKNFEVIKDKNIIVFCVGASPYDEKAIAEICSRTLKDELKDIPLFYCRGAWDEDKMTFPDKTLCKMLQKAVAKQDPSTYEPWQTALMCAVGKSCDWTDEEYLKPLIQHINNIEN